MASELRHVFVLAVALALAGCGVDGPPQRPAAQTGLSVGGTVEIGIKGGS